MLNLFNQDAFSEVLANLRDLGYRDGLLETDYEFPDWFSNKKARTVLAATFGRTPASYETACIGVVASNGVRAEALVDEYRALGAPYMLEVASNELRAWAVSRNVGGHSLIEKVPFTSIRQLFVEQAPKWTPSELLRAKNIGTFQRSPQLSLFAGLLPELEECIQQSLEPLLNEALEATRDVFKNETGNDPAPRELFKLIFWILTAKVFYDRRVEGFKSLTANSDAVLAAIARQYREDTTDLLTREARETAVAHIWSDLDFRNLSVEVLSQMWSTMLIDNETKRLLGIQRTSSTIVQYIIEKLKPFEQFGDDGRIIFEPCAGSSAFLVGAMNTLRPNLFLMSQRARHAYFTKHLFALERDPVGVEISRLALTLADFPSLGGWQVKEGDVFEANTMSTCLRRAGVVLCNPPFGAFDTKERAQYDLRSTSKPVELLYRVLDDLHPSGVLGFVLPRKIVDGKLYSSIRHRLAARFASIDVTELPDRAFEASVETALLIATDPIPHDVSKISFAKVNDNAMDWRKFELGHELSYTETVVKNPLQVAEGLGIPALNELWLFLSGNKVLDDIAVIHRGIEWNQSIKDAGEWLVRDDASSGHILGVPPKSKINVFLRPNFRFLNCETANQRRSGYKYDWSRPKVILGKAPRSRGRWKIAAFADTTGVACTSSFYGVWPKSEVDAYVLAAILNSPLANAFIATRESKREITKKILKRLPVPVVDSVRAERIRMLIEKYVKATENPLVKEPGAKPDLILKQIDAAVLDAYSLPPRIEHHLLKFFENQNIERETTHEFTDYLPKDYESYFSLSMHISPRFKKATAGSLRHRTQIGL